jgi:hypothetical protein
MECDGNGLARLESSLTVKHHCPTGPRLWRYLPLGLNGLNVFGSSKRLPIGSRSILIADLANEN